MWVPFWFVSQKNLIWIINKLANWNEQRFKDCIHTWARGRGGVILYLDWETSGFLFPRTNSRLPFPLSLSTYRFFKLNKYGFHPLSPFSCLQKIWLWILNNIKKTQNNLHVKQINIGGKYNRWKYDSPPLKFQTVPMYDCIQNHFKLCVLRITYKSIR